MRVSNELRKVAEKETKRKRISLENRFYLFIIEMVLTNLFSFFYSTPFQCSYNHAKFYDGKNNSQQVKRL